MCIRDSGATAYLSNRRGIDVSRNLVYQYLQGSADVNYYGFVALNGLTGGTSTDVFPGDNSTIRFEVYNLINAIYDSTSDTQLGDYRSYSCLLYTSDAADERSSADLGGCRIIKKNKTTKKKKQSIQ